MARITVKSVKLGIYIHSMSTYLKRKMKTNSSFNLQSFPTNIAQKKNENDSVPGIRDDGCEFWIVMNVESLHLCLLIVFECIFADNLEVGYILSCNTNHLLFCIIISPIFAMHLKTQYKLEELQKVNTTGHTPETS